MNSAIAIGAAAAAVVLLAVLAVRRLLSERGKRAKAEDDLEEARDVATAQARIEEQRARPRTGSDVLAWLRASKPKRQSAPGAGAMAGDGGRGPGSPSVLPGDSRVDGGGPRGKV